MARSHFSLIVSSPAAGPGGRQALASAFAALAPGSLDASDWIVGAGVFLAEILEQGGQRRQPVPDRAAAEIAPRQVVAPGDDVGLGHGAEFFRLGDAAGAHEIVDRVFVGAPGAAIADISEPLELRRDLGQALQLGGG